MWRLIPEKERPIYQFPYYKKLEKTKIFQGIFEVEEPGQPSDMVNQVFRLGTVLIKYVGEEELKDYWQTAEETSNRHAGDCEDMAIWLCRKCFVLGVKDIKFVVGKMKVGPFWKPKWLGHAWAEHGDFVYDIANYKARKRFGKLYGKSFKPFYAFDRSDRYRWEE